MHKDVPIAGPPRKRRVTPGFSGVHIGGNITEDELEFGLAIDAYKRQQGRPFPTWSEVLEVLRSLGYRKVAEKSEVPKIVR